MNATPNPKDSGPEPLTFGIYPGGSTGTESGLADGPPDDPTHIQEALRVLQGDVNQPFIVRGYEHFQDSPSVTTPNVLPSPIRVEQYIRDGRRLDLVVRFLSDSGDVEGYVAFVRERVRSRILCRLPRRQTSPVVPPLLMARIRMCERRWSKE